MISLVYFFCFAAFVLAALLGLPPDVREIVNENCRNSNGRLRLRYVLKEVRSLMRFYAQALFAAFLFACVGLVAIVVVDGFIKTEVVVSILERADWDPTQWRENLTTGPNSPKDQVTSAIIANGGTRDEARKIILFAWGMMPIAIMLSFASVIPLMQVMSTSYRNACRDMVNDEARRNLRRIRERYLRDSAQTASRIHQSESAHPTWTQR